MFLTAFGLLEASWACALAFTLGAGGEALRAGLALHWAALAALGLGPLAAALLRPLEEFREHARLAIAPGLGAAALIRAWTVWGYGGWADETGGAMLATAALAAYGVWLRRRDEPRA